MNKNLSNQKRLLRIIYWYVTAMFGGLILALVVFLNVEQPIPVGIWICISLLVVLLWGLMSFIGCKFTCKLMEYLSSFPEVRDAYPQTESEKRVSTIVGVVLLPISIALWIVMWFLYQWLAEEMGIPVWLFYGLSGIFLSALIIVLAARYRYSRSNKGGEED